MHIRNRKKNADARNGSSRSVQTAVSGLIGNHPAIHHSETIRFLMDARIGLA
jgi:hypothetical protein